jgi:ubiquinone/menaquinone biosynthesis C-methylase UbiE
MKKVWSLFACLALTAAVPALAQKDPHAGQQSFSDVEHWVSVFDDESRRVWQKPLEVLETLGIMEGDSVADIGAGTGYFTGLLTVQVGPEGKVYAVDLEQAMLDHIPTRIDVQPERLELVLAEPDDPKLPKGEIDLILIVDTWHHIQKRPKYLRKLSDALNPEGRVVIIDFREGELPVGPPAGHKLGRQEVIQEFEKAKWSLASESVMLPYQYFLTFYPPDKR